VTVLTASDENSEFVHAGVWQVTVHTEPVDAGRAMADVLRPEEAHLEAVNNHFLYLPLTDLFNSQLI